MRARRFEFDPFLKNKISKILCESGMAAAFEDYYVEVLEFRKPVVTKMVKENSNAVAEQIIQCIEDVARNMK